MGKQAFKSPTKSKKHKLRGGFSFKVKEGKQTLIQNVSKLVAHEKLFQKMFPNSTIAQKFTSG